MFQHDTKAKQNPNVMVKGQAKIVSRTDYAKFYKIILRSKDADEFDYNSGAGELNIHRFDNVSFPVAVDDNAVLIMESFVAENKDGELDDGYTVHIRELMQPRTWSSDRKGSSDIVLTGKGAVWQNGSVCVDSLGIPITNPTMFKNTSLTVEIKSILTDYPTFKVEGDWTLTFWLVVLNQENEFKV